MKKLKLIAFVAAFALAANAAKAQDDSALLDLLVKKKVISSQEAEQTKAELAQQYASTPAGKLSLSTPVQQIRLYGDARLRYEYREGGADLPPAGSHDTANADRVRYRLRLGADVTLTDDWFLGIRLETSNNGRSTNVTESQGQTNTAPFGKANTTTTTVVSGFTVKKNAAGAVTSVTPTTSTAVTSVNFGNTIFVGQLYMRYKLASWLTVEGGKMPNPFIATPMVWDPDINPEGFAEQFKYTFGPFGNGSTTAGYDKDGKSSKEVVTSEPGGMTVDVFANIAELVYDTASPQNQFGTSTASAGRNDTWMFGAQFGGRLNFNKGMYLQAAPTFYTYSGQQNSDFGAMYSGDPGGNQVGVNDLKIIDVPIEFGFNAFGLPITIFGDFADNLAANARANGSEFDLIAANAAGTPFLNDNGTKVAAHPGKTDGIAFQAGFRINKIKKKGDWTLAAYYQYSGAYSLDPNLIDDDIFDAHLNMQGIVGQVGYALTDAVTLNAEYNYGSIIDKSLGTGGAGGTISNSSSTPTLHNYSLMQLDCNVKF
ncbi:MAG: putative porin [Chthoniobacteraceae bacterium]